MGEILPESNTSPIYPALDGLRAIAVALVFLVHYGKIFRYGWVGVQLFFVLSGFLISGILFDTRNDSSRFKNFYARRALRIFPLYYGVVLLLLAVLFATHGAIPRVYGLWLIYLQNFFWLVRPNTVSDVLKTGDGIAFAAIGHLWSLAIEEQFYLLWPLFVFAIRDRRRLMQVCCVLIACRCGLAAYWQTHLPAAVLQSGIIYRMLPTQCDGFLMGGLLAFWLRGRPSKAILSKAGGLAAAALGLFASLILTLHFYPALIHGENVYDFSQSFQAVAGLPLSNLVAAVLILAISQPTTWAFRVCNLAVIRSLGRVSYGLYVFHLPILVLCTALPVGRHFASGMLAVVWQSHRVVAGALSVAAAYASFYLYERRFLLLKNRFRSARGPVEAAPGIDFAQDLTHT